MKGKKCLKKFLSLCLGLLLYCLLNFGQSQNASARTATSFGIRDWTSDNGSTWTTIGTPSDNGPNLGSTARYFRGLRLVNYGAWGNGNYYSGHVVMNVTLKSGLGSGLRTNRVGTGSYDAAVSANTYCALGNYGTSAKSYTATNFRATYLGASSGGTWKYDGWLVEWDFQGEMSSSYSGSYDAYCRIYPSSSNSEWFYFGTNSQTYIYIDTNTSLTIDVSTSQTDTLLQQQINQNNTMINQNNTIINQNNQIIEQDEEDRNNIEEQSQETQEQGQDASDEANQQGQTLLEAFGSLITAITNIHTTNCTIPNFSIYGLNFQNMDFCQFNVPNGLMALASIGMIFIFVPLGINLVKRMIALYNEILGGK